MDLKAYLNQQVARVDAALRDYLPSETVRPAALHGAMHYSVFAGGKRIRPVLMMASCEAVGGRAERVLPAACAIEMIHTYSLVHDDLPAMDDDDFRRGRPTNHKVYGEAIAILAGDALLTEAFVLLSRPEVWAEVDADTVRRVIHQLAKSSGCAGMVGGQVVDMESEGKSIERSELEYIHRHKTGALISAAIEIGGILGGANPDEAQALRDYGHAAGLAFQVADDILDIVGTQEELGKDIGSDQERGKATYPALMGLEAARDYARELKDRALQALEPLGPSAEPLRAIARYIVDRTT